MKRLCLTFLSLLVAVSGFSQRGTCGNGVSWTLNDGTLTISGNGEMNDFNTQRPSWDVYKDDITKVVVETGVTNIGSYAFRDYENLCQITLSEGLEIIGTDAFNGCTGIENFTLPQSLRSIKAGAFCGTSIYTLTIPEGLETINHGRISMSEVFEDCKNLTKVIWNAVNCSFTQSELTSPFRASSVSEVVFGENVKQIPEALFYECSTLTSVRTSGSISRVGGSAFDKTQWLGMLPEGLVFIDKALYMYNGTTTRAISIDIPEGTESITDEAFWSIRNNLVSITLPTTMKSFDERAFRDCSVLGRIEWNAENCEDFTGRSAYGDPASPFSNAPIYEVVFGNQVKRIPAFAFAGCTGPEEISLPSSVTSIGNHAFYKCKNLKQMDCGESVETIGEYAFYECSTLAGVEFGAALQSIGESAFYDCKKLESIVLPEGLTNLGPGAFGSTDNLKHVTFNAVDCHTSDFKFDTPIFTSPCQLETFTIGDKVTRIPYYICQDQRSLKAIVIPNSVKTIESDAFSDCSGIESLTIGENVETIGRAFGGCSGIKELIWNAVRTNNPESSDRRIIPSQAIEKLTLGENVEEIPDYLCYNCTQLNELTLPAGVKRIGRQAFDNTGLTEVFIPSGVEETDWRAFANNKLLQRAIIPSNQALKASAPFDGCSALESIMAPDVAVYEEESDWSSYLELIKPMVSFTDNSFIYSGKLPETEAVNNLTGYTLQLGTLELHETAGIHTAWAEASYTGPHAFTVNVPFRYQIDKAPLTLTPADVEMVYGDTKPDTYTYTAEGLVNDETLEEAFDVLPEFSTNTEERVQAGSYAIRLANTPAAQNYTVSCNEGVMTVTPKPLHVSAVSISRPYGEENPELELTYEGFAFDDDAVVLQSAPQATCEADSWSDVGDYDIVVSGGSDKNYTFEYVNGVLSVTPAQQEIVWNQELPELHVGDNIALQAYATSELPVLFTTDTPEVCSISCIDGRYFIECLAEGTARVQATQAGDGNWQAAESVVRELPVATATDIAGHEADHIAVYAEQGEIVVEGAADNTAVHVYTLEGVLLRSEVCHGSALRLTMKQSAIYVVNVGGRFFKLMVK